MVNNAYQVNWVFVDIVIIILLLLLLLGVKIFKHLLLIKTTEEKSDLLIQKINEIHSYSEPECIGIKIEKGSETYLKWIKESVK